MKPNIGNTERVIRIVIGLALLAFTFVNTESWRWIGLIGIVPIVTAIIRWCPLWSIFRINTDKSQ